MNRNISIVVILLVLVVIAGYLIWLRSRVTSPTPTTNIETQASLTPEPTLVATSSAIPVPTEATGSIRGRTSTPGATRR